MTSSLTFHYLLTPNSINGLCYVTISDTGPKSRGTRDKNKVNCKDCLRKIQTLT